jgi:hypothetical protein
VKAFNRLLDGLVNKWTTERVPYLPAASPSEIREFESRFNLRMPSEVAQYFGKVGGMAPEACDRDYIRFWPLGEVSPAASHLGGARGTFSDFFVFADFSLWTHAYATNMRSPDGLVAIVGGEAPMIIADSFAEFISLYINEPLSIFRADASGFGGPGRSKKIQK